MQFKWKKLGLIFEPQGYAPWLYSHASAPTPLMLSDGLARVYFTGRDKWGYSNISFFDFDLKNRKTIPKLTNETVLSPGPLGHFDGHGIYCSSLVRHTNKIFMYTIGWNPGQFQPLFYSSIGLAISEDNGETFKKYGQAPILDRSNVDPCLVTAPAVIKEKDIWKMWYVSGVNWINVEGQTKSKYLVKYAESNDGISWRTDGRIAINFAHENETNISRTWVIPPTLNKNKMYTGWYSYDSGNGYRIGYATSIDGLNWQRKDKSAGILPSNYDWENRAQAYPAIVSYEDKLYMFYNGNRFGYDGIGLAVCSPEDTAEY